MEHIVSNEVKLIRAQIDKLFEKRFDLEAWKTLTIVLLERIFGNESVKIKQIESLKYDYSSWALRDASGVENNMDTCKKSGMNILEAAIFELEQFGAVPVETGEQTESVVNAKRIVEFVDDELKGSQLKAIMEILESKDAPDDMKSRLVGKLKEFGYDVSSNILASILLFPEITKILKQ